MSSFITWLIVALDILKTNLIFMKLILENRFLFKWFCNILWDTFDGDTVTHVLCLKINAYVHNISRLTNKCQFRYNYLYMLDLIHIVFLIKCLKINLNLKDI